MDGIRRNQQVDMGLLGALSVPRTLPQGTEGSAAGVKSAPPPPPPPPPPVKQAERSPAQTSDDLSRRLASYRASQNIPAISQADELRDTVNEVGKLLASSDAVPFRFDRNAVAHLMPSPSGGPLRAQPSPPSPPTREPVTPSAPPRASAGGGSDPQVTGLLSFLGGKF